MKEKMSQEKIIDDNNLDIIKNNSISEDIDDEFER